MATFESPQTYELGSVELWKKVVRIKDIELQLPLCLGSLRVPSPFGQQGTIVISDVPYLGQELRVDVPTHEHVFEFYVEKVSAISQVRCVAVYVENEIIHIWSVIPARDKQVQRMVYNVELQLMEKFPGFSYDFNVLFYAGVDMGIFLPSEAKVIYYCNQGN